MTTVTLEQPQECSKSSVSIGQIIRDLCYKWLKEIGSILCIDLEITLRDILMTVLRVCLYDFQWHTLTSPIHVISDSNYHITISVCVTYGPKYLLCTEIVVHFIHSTCSTESIEDFSVQIQTVIRRNPKNSLQVENIQFLQPPL